MCVLLLLNAGGAEILRRLPEFLSGLEFEEIPEQVISRFGQKALRMELHAVYGVFPMLQPHDFKPLTFFVYPCRDFKAIRKALAGDDQTVVSGGREWIGQIRKDTSAGVRDF